MKLQGKLLNWDDNRGYGFVEPKGGGQRAFVHIKAFSFYSRRPQSGDIIQYQTSQDRKGKLRAIEINLVNDHPTGNKPRPKTASKPPSQRSKRRIPLVLPFLALLGGLIWFQRIPLEVLYVYGVVSLIAFVMYALDKSAARANRWRTPESHLHLIALVGGWPGAYLAQQWLRHKSAKRSFKAIFWFTVVLNLTALGYLLTPGGQALLTGIVGVR